MSPSGEDLWHSIQAGATPRLRPKEKAMYDDGFSVAVVLGVLALVLPALWIAWWYLADVEEAVNGSDHTRPRAV
jgi:hypothetical protein